MTTFEAAMFLVLFGCVAHLYIREPKRNPKGERGAVGEMGLTGNDGPTGPQGERGPAGPARKK